MRLKQSVKLSKCITIKKIKQNKVENIPMVYIS